jgi:CheY-like chemotaxis protein
MKSLLLVDDDLAVLKSLDKLFRKTGYEVICCTDGRQALAWVKKRGFDLVVIDIRMSDLDGVETVRAIKEARKACCQPDIPVVFITGYSDVVAVDKAKTFGDVVLKPFDLEDLLSRVKQQAAKSKSPRDEQTGIQDNP